MLVEELAILAMLVVINAVVDTIIVLVVLSGRTERMMGVTKVRSSNGDEIYAPLGPDGEAIQIPIGTKEDEEGVVKPVMGYAPLGYTLAWLAADAAAVKVKMGLLNAKGQISKAIQGRALAEGDMDALMGILPKKAQAAIAIAKMLGLGVNKSQPDGGNQNPPRSGQGKAI